MGSDIEKQLEQDRIDYGNELAGREVGRIHRFISSDNPNSPSGQEKQRRKQEYTDMLAYLLANDPLYAKLYFEVEDNLNQAQDAVDAARAEITSQLALSNAHIQDMEENATRLNDGTRVFLDKNAQIYTQSGQRLAPEHMQGIEIDHDAPSWEAYTAEREKAALCSQQLVELDVYQRDTLNVVRARLNDDENPPLMDELKDLQQALQDKMPPSVKLKMETGLVEHGFSNEISNGVFNDITPEQNSDINSTKPNFSPLTL